MEQIPTLFLVTFTTLLAMINPLESIPVFLKLLEGKDDKEHCKVARRCCFYALLMMLFFVIFGTVVLKVFGVPLSMVRIVGGIILVKIGFEMFLPSSSGGMFPPPGGANGQDEDYSFVPLAIPIMFGPGALATVLGMSAMVKNPIANMGHMVAILLAIVATMFVTYLALIYARRIIGRIGAKGVDAVTRLVGFFVSAMGMGLVFHGLVEVLQLYGVIGVKAL